MSKYMELNLKWHFTTKEGRAQFKCLFYRIYINIFGVFLKIPILPLKISLKWKQLDIWYKGDEIICYIKKGKIRYLSLSSEGSFSSLKEIDAFWEEYENAERQIWEKEYSDRNKIQV